MRGLTALRREFSILNFWDTENNKVITEFRGDSDREDWETYQELRKSTETPKSLIMSRGDRRRYFHSYEEGGDDIQILAPNSDLTELANNSDNHNNHSK
jgi:fatty acid-binding protein DegV